VVLNFLFFHCASAILSPVPEGTELTEVYIISIDHFEFAFIGQQTEGEAFDVKITAMQSLGDNGYTIYDFNGEGILTDSKTGFKKTVYFNGGNCITSVTINTVAYNNKLTISAINPIWNNTVNSQSNTFNIVSVSDPAYLDHFEFDSIDSKNVGESFTVRITALDQYGNIYADYNGEGILSDLQTDLSMMVQFSGGIGKPELTINTAVSNNQLIIKGGYSISLKSGTSNTFNIISRSDDSGIALYVLFFVILVVGGVAFYFIWRKGFLKRAKPAPSRPIPKPALIRVSADPVTIVANGVSKSTLSVQLLDENEKTVVASSDLVVELFAAKGKLARSTVTIPKGESMAKTYLTSSLDRGSFLVSAHVEGLLKGEVVLNFKEEDLRCLYCGAVTTSMYEPCPQCGRIPP
jgi:hypothetical protein